MAHLVYPKFHVPIWKQFCRVFIVLEQRKSQIKALVKYIERWVTVKQLGLRCYPRVS